MKSILTLTFVLIHLLAFAKTDTVLVEDLRYSWLSMEENVAQPIVDAKKVKLLSFTLKNPIGDLLKICNDEPFDLWINMRLIKTGVDDCITINLLSLYNSSDVEELNFQLRCESGVGLLTTGLYSIENESDSSVNFFSIHHRSFHAFYVIMITVLLIFTAVYRRFFPQRFDKLLLNPFKFRGSSTEDYYSDFFDSANIYALCYMSIIIGFVHQFFSQKTKIGLHESISAYDMTIDLLLFSGLILLFLLIKYAVGQVASLVFAFRNANNIHNQDFMNFFTWIFYTVLLLSLIDFSFAYTDVFIPFSIPSIFIVIGIVVFQFGMYFKLQRYIPHNKIMIISYLCATEFIPGFILIYLLLK